VASGRWRDALAVAKQEHKNNDGWAEAEVMTHLVETGRRETVPAIDAGTPMTPGNGTGAIAMTITPDGGTVFVAGVSGVYVQPVP
jgi:3-hydroxy-3-methylglutaryl CoA synthase